MAALAGSSMKRFPLAGIKVLELSGLAPVPFVGMFLADYGASVCRINRTNESFTLDSLARGKKSISLDLKSQKGSIVLKRLAEHSDVLIEPFRPGIMEKLNLGPDDLFALNEKLIYVRLNGFGSKETCMSDRAGHDINYLAISGILSRLGRRGEKPNPPINLLGDFAGGSMIAVAGILMALIERSVSQKGQIVDASITAGAAYISSFLHRSQHLPIWLGERGTSVLDGGAPFYEVYKTKDKKYMAVGAIEPQFYRELLKGLDLLYDEAALQQMNFAEWSAIKKKFEDTFLQKTQNEWSIIFQNTDACVTPVVDFKDAPHHPHNIDSESYMYNKETWQYEPAPAPKLSRTPGRNTVLPEPKIGEHTVEYLRSENFTEKEIDMLLEENVIEQWTPSSSL